LPFFFLIIVLVIVLIGVVAGRYSKAVAAAWTEAASRLGLDYQQRGFARPRLEGVIDGMRVAVDVRVQRSGNNSQNFTRYRVWAPTRGFAFRLSRQTGLSKIGKLFGAQDVELGDPGFDDAFVVKTDDEPQLRNVLDSRLMGLLVRTEAAYPGTVFKDGLVSYRKRGLETDADVIVSALARFAEAAAALGGVRLSNAAEDVVAARRRGELAEIADKMRRTERRAETLDEELVELDTLATAGDRAEAERRLRRLERRAPADPEVRGWRERLAQPPPAPAPVAEIIDAEELAENMFAGTSLSFESKQVFDQHYRGGTIRWQGRAKTVDRIHTDSHLGKAGDDKLIATVATIEHDLYGNTEIDAVVALPAGTGSRLRRGDDVSFTGTLVGVDALVRNILVADGRLV
jgi:hypothetical protein